MRRLAKKRIWHKKQTNMLSRVLDRVVGVVGSAQWQWQPQPQEEEDFCTLLQREPAAPGFWCAGEHKTLLLLWLLL